SAGPDTFEVGSPLTLILHRESERQLSVRLEAQGAQGDAGDTQLDLQLPLEPDHDRLDVVSAVGSTRLLSAVAAAGRDSCCGDEQTDELFHNPLCARCRALPGAGVAVDGHLMAVDERVRVLFRASSASGWLALGLCDETACSAVRLTGLHPPAYTTRITRGTSVGDTEQGELLDEARPPGVAATPFVPGRNYTLWAHRVSGAALDVWVDGDPGAKVSLPLGPDRTVFKVDSNAGSTFLDTRGAADGWPLGLGEQLWISLDADAPLGRLYLGLCGDASCSVVRVRGVDDGRMGYSTAVIDTNSVSGRGDDLAEQTGPTGFTAGRRHVFVVRRAEHALEAWLEDDPDNKAAVRLAPGDTRFKVTSTAGTTTFVRGTLINQVSNPSTL
ncbi:Alcohol dehydrogenase 1, partial [Frankliniella fusca]